VPSWIPGSYLLREYARHVIAVRASSQGRSVTVTKHDHATWQCMGATESLTVVATVYALDESVRGAYLDARRAYFNGPCVFMLPEGREGRPAELEIERPPNAECAAWRVATAMTPVAVDEQGFGRYSALDYDELLDHPCEIGPFAEIVFEAAGVPHRLAIAGRIDTDLERVAEDLAAICTTQIEFFGRPAPFASYLFLGLAVGDGYGGLEHRASSSLIFRRDDLPRPGEPALPQDYRRFLALASHEYFHSWHIKRTRPAAFVPYRLDRRNHTRLLWVFEGITSYYQERMVLLSGLFGAGAYLKRLAEHLTRVYRVPGRFVHSLAESSFDAWDVLYKPEANTPNSSVSYYSKGALTALALDLRLRRDHGTSLDAIVRELWRRFGALAVGVPEGGFEALVAELAGPGLETFFEQAVRGTEDLPIEEWLGDFGVRMQLRAARGADDRGGIVLEDEEPVALGAALRAHPQGVELTTVLHGGAAERAGLNHGDVVVALDGLRVGERTLKARLARYVPGASVAVSVFRGDELLTLPLILTEAAADTVGLELDAAAAGSALERRLAWLGE
jgi:predicted metalloprotease with PDZ domain